MNNYDHNFDDIVTLFWNNENPQIEQKSQSQDNLNSLNSIVSKYFVNNESNNTKTTCDSNPGNNFTTENIIPAITSINVVEEPKKHKTFHIKKYVKYEEIIKEFCSEDDDSVIDNKTKILREKRIKFIKNNNKKLSNLEKLKKLKILSKVVKRYRRKLKNLKKKFKDNSDKIFQKYLNKKIKKIKKNPKNKNFQKNLSLSKLIIALQKLKDKDNGLEFAQDRSALENFINLIISGKIRLDSIQFKKIASQVRNLLEEDTIQPIIGNPKIFINLPEKKVYITKTELDYYKNAGNNEDIFRSILGFKKNYNLEENESCENIFSLKKNLSEDSFQGMYDPILDSLINKNNSLSNEFCNNLF